MKVRWELALLALLVGLAGGSAALLAGQAVSPHPLHWAGFGVDRMSISIGLLVAAVGAVTFRFSMRYLDGEPGRGRFLARLAFTVVSAYAFVLSDHLLVMFACWSLTSLGLHGLLTHYPDRPEALRPARKKFLISRLGDVALIAVIVLIGIHWGTLELGTFLAHARDTEASERAALGAVAVLIVIAAMTKSAQFPFHSWLPETMEAPTPVSALMHAGVINAGGVLVLRFSPVIVRVPLAMLLLSLVGTMTVVVAMPAMWSQVKVKRTLAWSTVGQMGFMMVQFGLAVFPAAWLHILGHGLYKAWSFLRTGGVAAAPPLSAASPAQTLGLGLVGTLMAIPALMVASRVTGFSPQDSPGETALAAVVALSIGQFWVAIFQGPASGVRVIRIVGAIGGTYLAALAAFALYRGAAIFLSPVIGPLPHPGGPLSRVAAAVPVAAIVGLLIMQALLPVLGRSSTGRALYVHALNGFYFGVIADVVVDRVWVRLSRIRKGVQGA